MGIMTSRAHGWCAGLLALAVLAGCEREPLGPDASEEASLGELTFQLYADSAADAGAAARAQEHQYELTLQALLKAAFQKVAEEQGREAAAALHDRLAPLVQAVREARAAGDRERYEQAVAELTAAQIGIVLEVLGEDTPGRVIDGVTVALEALKARAAELRAAGKDVHRPAALIERAERLLAEAREALAGGELARALHAGTQAAGLVPEIRFALAVLDGTWIPIPGLDALFRQAVHAVAEAQGRDAAHAILAELESLQRARREAQAAGDRDAVQRARQALLAFKIRVVVGALGPAAVTSAIDAATRVLEQVDQKIAAAKEAGRDVARLEHAAAEAAEQLAQAQAELEAGKPAEALADALRAAHRVEALRHALFRLGLW